MNLLFIVGSPRSGTTLLQKYLVDNYGFRSLPETHYFSMLISQFGEKYTDMTMAFDRHDYDQMKEMCESRIRIKFPIYNKEDNIKSFFYRILDLNINNLDKQDLIIEKTPNHGTYVNIITKVINNASFIHIIRHPLDCVASMYDIQQSSKNDIRFGKKPNIKLYCDTWRNNVFTCLEFGTRSERIVHVRYEDLIKDMDNNVMSLVQKLGIENYIRKDTEYGDQLYDKIWEPWKKTVELKNIIDRSNVWKTRISKRKAQKIEKYLNREMQYLNYSSKTL